MYPKFKKVKQFDNQTHVTPSKTKRIGYFAALLLVMGSSIGSGIFFKSGSVMSNVDNSIILSLFSWLIAALAVIAMAIALIDVAAESKKDDRGLLSWIKRFNGMYLYKSGKNLYCFFTLPIKFFGLPVYFFQSLQSGLAYIGAHYVSTPMGDVIQLSSFGQSVLDIQWWVILLVVIGIDLWFLIVNGFSIRMGNLTNKALMYVKFVPLTFAFLIGFVILGINKGQIPPENHWWVDTQSLTISNGILTDAASTVAPQTFVGLSPAIGVFVSLAAIFFAYDGFYVAAGIQKQMREPRKISSVLLFGLLIVTAIYVSIALSLTFGAPGGKWQNVADFFVKKNLAWIYSVIAILISIGILGVINGYSLWSSRLYSELIDSRELPFSNKLAKLNKNGKDYGGMIYILVLVLVLSISFVIIGALAYQVQNTKNVVGNYRLVDSVNNIYRFADMITNWQTIFTFAFIMLAIAASTKNKMVRQENKTRKDYIEITAGFVSATIIGIALIFQVIQPFVNLGLAVSFNNAHPEASVQIFPSICLIAILGVASGICFIPSIFEVRNQKAVQIFELEAQIWELQRQKAKLEALKEHAHH